MPIVLLCHDGLRDHTDRARITPRPLFLVSIGPPLGGMHADFGEHGRNPMTQGNDQSGNSADAVPEHLSAPAAPSTSAPTPSGSVESGERSSRDVAGGGRFAAFELPLALVLSLVSAPVVIVADRPASSIGAVIAVAFLIGIWIHRSISRSRESGDAAQARRRVVIISYAAAGAAGVLATLFAVPATRSFISHDLIGFPVPSEPVTVAGVRTGETEGEKSVRGGGGDEKIKRHVIELTVRNDGDADELVKVIHLTVPADYSMQCAASGDYSAMLDSEATVVRSKTAKRIDWIGTFAESGPGKHVDFDATLIVHCGGGSEVKFSIPVSVALPPHKFTRINLELPSEFQWTGSGYSDPWKVKVVLPQGIGAATDSAAAADRMRFNLDITGDKVVVYRE